MKLSGSQLLWIIVTTEIITIIGLRVSPAIIIAKQDAWMSMLLGGVLGLPLNYLVVRLSARFPNRTLVQFSQTILGKWLGKAIVFPYLVVWYWLSSSLLRSFSDFLHLVLVDRTPVWVIMALLIGLTIYITHAGGITGIGRFCEIMGPIIIFMLMLSYMLNLGNVDWHHIRPVYYDSGWQSILKGSIGPAFWFAGPFTLFVIVSFMQKPRIAMSRSMFGIAISAFMVFIATLMVLLVFGPNLSGKTRFSYFMYVRTIDILNFIQNLDIFIMFIWIFGVSAQLSLYFFIANYETANWLGVKKWRRLIWFGAPVILAVAISIPDETAITSYDHLWTFYIFPACGIAIPLLLLIVASVRKKPAKGA